MNKQMIAPGFYLATSAVSWLDRGKVYRLHHAPNGTPILTGSGLAHAKLAGDGPHDFLQPLTNLHEGMVVFRSPKTVGGAIEMVITNSRFTVGLPVSAKLESWMQIKAVRSTDGNWSFLTYVKGTRYKGLVEITTALDSVAMLRWCESKI